MKPRIRYLILTVILIIFYVLCQNTNIFWLQESFEQFQEEIDAHENDFQLLDYLDPLQLVAGAHIIHFLEGYGHTTLRSRMWCAVEAASRVNPAAVVSIRRFNL